MKKIRIFITLIQNAPTITLCRRELLAIMKSAV